MTKKFLVESPHTKATCLQALDEVASKGSDILSKFQWGCAAGDHTGYAFLDGSSKSDVSEKLPSVGRDKSKVVEVGAFTQDQIRSFH